MIGIEEVPEPDESIDVFEDGLILPVPAGERNTIHFEERDGSNIQRLTASHVELRAGGKTVFKAPDVKLDVFITDARVAFACSKFDKGGGWIGGPATLVLNAGSKALAARRRRGKMLVGQMRFPWISNVGSTTKTGWLSEENLYFDASFSKGESCRMTLQLPKNVSASRAAAEIARRAATYRLAVEDELSDDERQALEQLAECEPLTSSVKNQISFHQFPTHWFVNEKSARLSPAEIAPAAAAEALRSPVEVPSATAEVPLPAAQVPAAEAMPSVQLEEVQVFCEQCGARVGEHDRFCASCGKLARVETSSRQDDPQVAAVDQTSAR